MNTPAVLWGVPAHLGCWCEAQLHLGSTAVTLSDEQQLKAYYLFLGNIMSGDLYEFIL